MGPHVLSWANQPSKADGFTSGRVVNVWTHSRYLWAAQPTTMAKVMTDKEWVDVADTSLRFELSEPADMHLLYSMVVRPDQKDGVAGENGGGSFLNHRDDVGARLLVDGLPYRESGSVLSLTCLVSCSGILEGSVTLPLAPGNHTVVLQWHKYGTLTRAWRSDPGLLDGYASSRILMVLGERIGGSGSVSGSGGGNAVVATQPFERARTQDRQWQTVGKHSLTFNMDQSASVLFSYALPVSQASHPTFDSWTYNLWSSIEARLVVDSIPYR